MSFPSLNELAWEKEGATEQSGDCPQIVSDSLDRVISEKTKGSGFSV